MTTYDIIIECIGWASTLILVASFFLQKRSSLHLVGFLACVLKLIYTYEHEVWPLFANWAILVVVQAYLYIMHRKKTE